MGLSVVAGPTTVGMMVGEAAFFLVGHQSLLHMVAAGSLVG